MNTFLGLAGWLQGHTFCANRDVVLDPGTHEPIIAGRHAIIRVTTATVGLVLGRQPDHPEIVGTARRNTDQTNTTARPWTDDQTPETSWEVATFRHARPRAPRERLSTRLAGREATTMAAPLTRGAAEGAAADACRHGGPTTGRAIAMATADFPATTATGAETV
jgi:hypothetical protein